MKTTLKKATLRISSLLTVLVSLTSITSRAVDGSWNVDLDGNWSTPANWLGNIVADGADSTANFTIDHTAVRTVTLDTARTNGNLTFGDADTSTPGGWVLTGNPLTLTNSAATPLITVNTIQIPSVSLIDMTNDVRILSPITSGQGFIKKGPGTLTLNGTNNFSSSVRLDEGTVAIGAAAALGSGNRAVIFNGGGVRVWTGGPAFANTNNLLTSGSLISSNGNYDAYNGIWTGSGTMVVHATGRLTPGNGAAATYTGFTGTIDLSDSTGQNETRVNLGTGATPYDMSTVTLNTGTNGGRFSFRTSVAPATVRIGALKGDGPFTRLMSSEQGTGTSLTWEIGYLNTSTIFAGIIQNRNGDPLRVGHLMKVGTGRLTLTGTNTYTGNTTVSNGVLALGATGVITASTNFTVLSSGTFDVSALPAPFTLINASSTLNGSGVVTGDVAITTGTISPGSGAGNLGTLRFTNNLSIDGTLGTTTNLFEIATGNNDQVRVGDNLTLAGTVVFRLVPTGPSIPNGTYTLVQWGGTLTGDTNNILLSYAPQPGSIILGTNLVSKTIFIQVSGASSSDLTWRGDGAVNDWDVNATANWRTTNGTPSVFNNGDNVTFNDTGSNTPPVNIVGVANPGVVLITNVAKDYELSSSVAGRISGSAVINKAGTGKLILSTDNDNSGPVTISAGTLQVGNGGSSGLLGTGSVTNNSLLIYNRADVTGNAGPISGTGNLVQAGVGTLSLTGVNGYSGNTVVSNGILSVGGANAIGTGTLVIAGGEVDAGSLALANPINVVDNGTINNLTGEIQLTSDSINGAAGKTLTLAGSTIRFTGSGFSINSDVVLNLTALQSYNQFGTQIFNGVISGVGTYRRRWPVSDLANTGTTIMNGANTYSGTTLLREGSIGFGISSVSTTPGTIDSGPIGTGALNQDGGTIYTAVFASGGARDVGNQIVLNPTGPSFTIKGGFDLTLSGPIDLGTGSKAVQVENTAKTIFAGDVSNGDLVKTGPGALYINGTNFANSTTVSAGALGGTGNCSGPVTVQSGAALAPGGSIGTLTLGSDLTIEGNLLIEVNKSLVQSNDFTDVTGTLSASGSGTVTVTNLGPALTVGNKFILFNKPLVNGGVLSITGGGATWSNSLAIDGAITVTAVGPAPHPVITSTIVSGGNIIFSGTNGTAGGTYFVLSSTNLAVPLSLWAPESTNTFGVGGAFSVTNPISSALARKFYLLKLP